tara:strand:+ start:729 stop:989 length:261 start_codon:yes stop_codon:yes gene_type:complete
MMEKIIEKIKERMKQSKKRALERNILFSKLIDNDRKCRALRLTMARKYIKDGNLLEDERSMKRFIKSMDLTVEQLNIRKQLKYQAS